MSRLELHLFGSPRMEVNGAPVEVDTRKATALMAYLAVSGETHQRDTLAALLWPDYDQTNARGALRRTLSTLNRALEQTVGEKVLEISRESVGLAEGADIWLDVAEFRWRVGSLAAHGHASSEICPSCIETLKAAVTTGMAGGEYHEPFMAGFNLRDSPNFEEWQFFQEETLSRERAGVLEKLAFGLAACGRAEEAIPYARSWLALDTLSEEAHRQLMELYLRAGQRNAALRQYRECVRILDQELGVAPLEETTRLYQAILNHEALPEPGGRLRYIEEAPSPALAVPGTGAVTISRPAGAADAARAADAAPAIAPEAANNEAEGPLVGRQVELEHLRKIFAQATSGASGNRGPAERGAGPASRALGPAERGAGPASRASGPAERGAGPAGRALGPAERGAGPHFITLEGEAGIGKTRLAEAFLREARGQGANILRARCYAGEAGLAYAPFIEALSSAMSQPGAAARLKSLPAGTLVEAGRLLPEIASLAPRGDGAQALSFLSGDVAQARFFEALRQVLQALLAAPLTGPVPGVLFLDNLQWADSASLDLLTYLARRLKSGGILLVAAWRSEQRETDQCLERLAAELARGGQAARLALRRLTEMEVVELVHATLDTAPASKQAEASRHAEALGKRLYQESEGLPFVAVEYLAVQAQRGGLAPNKDEKSQSGAAALDWEMPASVRDLLRSRLESLDAAAMQLLSSAAVIGRSFGFNTLREVSGRSEMETVDGLDALLAAGVVREQSGPGQAGAGSGRETAREIRYDFTHEKLRATLYEETSQARRRLLHRRTAETLERQPGSRTETPGLVAYHYEQAGLDGPAAEYHLLAGERARQLFANNEALAHFQAALAAGHPDAAGLHEAIGDLRVLLGQYNAALESYQTAAALCVPGCMANLEHKLGNIHQRLGEWELADRHYQASLEALGDAPESTFHVHLFADRGLAAYARGDLDAAQSLASRALELAKRLAARPQPGPGETQAAAEAEAQAYNVLGVLARARGEYAQAIQALEASLRAAETLDHLPARMAALNNLALVHGENGAADEAIRLASQALELCQKLGDRHREAALHNNLADLLHHAGREDEAMAQLKQAVVIFAEIGSSAEAAQPEIWKLTEW